MIDNMDFHYEFDANGELLFPIIAFGDNPYAGKNSRIGRSLRARAQRRDKKGQFARMSGYSGFSYIGKDGKRYTAVGVYVGASNAEGYAQVYVSKDPNGLTDGIYHIKENNLTQYEGLITSQQLAKQGIDTEEMGGVSVKTPKIADVPYDAAPEGWSKNAKGNFVSEDDAYTIVTPKDDVKSFNLYKGTSTTNANLIYNDSNLGKVLVDVDERDISSSLTTDNKKKLADLQTAKQAADKASQGSGPRADKASEEADAIRAQIADILNTGELDENSTEQNTISRPEDTEVSETDAPKVAPAETKVKVNPTTTSQKDLDNPRANTPQNLKTKWGKIAPAMKDAQRAIGQYQNKSEKSKTPATAQETSDLLTAIDSAFTKDGAVGLDAEVDSFQQLAKEYFGINGFISQNNAQAAKLSAGEKKDEFLKEASDLAARKKEIAPQVSALQKSIATRGNTQSPLLDVSSVDLSTNFPDTAQYEAPTYRGIATRGRPKKVATVPTGDQQKNAAPAAPATPAGGISRRTTLDGWAGDQTLADWRNANDKYLAEKDQTNNGNLSHQAMATAEIQGMDGAPKALSDTEFDTFGGEPLFRGFGSSDSKQKFYEDDNWVGSGGNGTGIYTSTSKAHAGRYGNFDDSQIIDLKLRPDAIIIDGLELEARRKTDFDKAMAEGNLLGAQLANGDLGIYATSIGVDGYRLEIEGFPSVVLTNREAVVARKSDSYITEPTTPKATPVAPVAQTPTQAAIASKRAELADAARNSARARVSGTPAEKKAAEARLAALDADYAQQQEMTAKAKALRDFLDSSVSDTIKDDVRANNENRIVELTDAADDLNEERIRKGTTGEAPATDRNVVYDALLNDAEYEIKITKAAPADTTQEKLDLRANRAPKAATPAKAPIPAAPSAAKAPAAPKARKQGQVSDAPETGTTKTGTRKRVSSAQELVDAPAGTVIHRFNGNGTFDDSTYGSASPRAGVGSYNSPYRDSIVKGEDKKWYTVSNKTGNPVGKPVDRSQLFEDARSSYGSRMVFDTPDDGSTPETMYARSNKISADMAVEIAAKQDKAIADAKAKLEANKPAATPTPVVTRPSGIPTGPDMVYGDETVESLEQIQDFPIGHRITVGSMGFGQTYERTGRGWSQVDKTTDIAGGNESNSKDFEDGIAAGSVKTGANIQKQEETATPTLTPEEQLQDLLNKDTGQPSDDPEGIAVRAEYGALLDKLANEQFDASISNEELFSQVGTIPGTFTSLKSYVRDMYRNLLQQRVESGEISKQDSPIAYPNPIDPDSTEPQVYLSADSVILGTESSDSRYRSGGVDLQGNEIFVDPQEIPEDLYHVTTAVDAVIDSGRIKTSGGSAGLGGAHRNTVSLAPSEEAARGIIADMRDMIAIAKSDAPKQFIRERAAREGVDVEEWLNTITDLKLQTPYQLRDALSGYHYRRFLQTGKGKSPIMGLGNDWWDTADPAQIAAIKIPKQNIIDMNAAVAKMPIEPEYRVAGDIPVDSSMRLPDAPEAESTSGIADSGESSDDITRDVTAKYDFEYGSNPNHRYIVAENETGLPTVASTDELQKAIDAGATPIYRVEGLSWSNPGEDGETEDSVADTPEARAEGLRTGKKSPLKDGDFGFGIYFGDNYEEILTNYGEADGQDYVVGAALSADAKVISSDEIRKIALKLKEDYVRPEGQITGTNRDHLINEGLKNNFSSTLGAVASELGYDAIVADQGDGTNYYVVLNRAKLIVADQDIRNNTSAATLTPNQEAANNLKAGDSVDRINYDDLPTGTVIRVGYQAPEPAKFGGRAAYKGTPGELWTKQADGTWVGTDRNGNPATNTGRDLRETSSGYAGTNLLEEMGTNPSVEPENTTTPADSPTDLPEGYEVLDVPSSQLRRGDLAANGEIARTYRDSKTPSGKIEVVYTRKKDGVVVKGTWWSGTQITVYRKKAQPIDPNAPAPVLYTPPPRVPRAVPAPVVPTPKTTTPLDSSADLKTQLDAAIEAGNDVSFYYQGSGTETTLRTVTPQRVWNNPRSGEDNLTALQTEDGVKKNYTLSKMENAPAPEDTTATPEDTTDSTTSDELTDNADKVGSSELTVDVTTAPKDEAEVTAADSKSPTTEDTTAATGADLSLITTRTTDADYAGEDYLPTEEQRNVIDATVSGLDVAVQALAGSGKTSTLVLASKRMMEYHPDKRILYIAFNKTVQLEAAERMPSENTEARTGDSLGYLGVPANIRAKMGTENRKKLVGLPRQIADALNIPKTDKTRADIAQGVVKVIEKFAISDSDEITRQHFDDANVPFNSKNLAYAQMYWADINSPDGVAKFKVNNSHLTKIWALTKPDLSKKYGGTAGSFGKADVIFFDEAQDINPVMAKVIRDQTIQKIYVGDSRQAIYGFRGADDELDKVETDIILPMTRTFRFGQTLAGPGNRMLSLLDSPYKIIGAGKTDGIVVPSGTMNNADAILTRSNGGRFASIIDELGKGRVVGILKKDKGDVDSMIATVRWLQGDGGNKPYNFHEDFDGYTSWSQVENDVRRKKADSKIVTINNIVTKYSPDELEKIIARVVIVPEKGDIVDPSTVSTLSFEDGASGTFMPKITYTVSLEPDGTKRLSLTGRPLYGMKEKILKPNRFQWDNDAKTWSRTGTDAELTDISAKVRGTDITEMPKIDVLVITAHKAKGLEWNNVRIGDDFRGPEVSEEGDLIFPDKQELNLAYVALTRAQSSIDPGSLSWVFDYTDANDEDPNAPARGLPAGVIQNGELVAERTAVEPVIEAPEEPVVAPAEPTPAETVAPIPVPASKTAETTPVAPAPVAPRPPLLTRPEGWSVVSFDEPYTLSSDTARNPSNISEKFTTDEIKTALKRGLVNESDSKIGGDIVAPRDLYEALNQQGVDAREFVAQTYDAANGNTDNVDELKKFYSDNPDMKPTASNPTPADSIPAPAKKQTKAPLTPNTSSDNLDPAPADATDTGVEGTSNDPAVIAETFDNADLVKALEDATKNDLPGIPLEFPNGETVVSPVENVRDALQKQGTNTNDVIDEANGTSGVAQDAPEDLTDGGPSADPVKLFTLDNFLRTREVPNETGSAIEAILNNPDATDDQLDWAIDIMTSQPLITFAPKSKAPDSNTVEDKLDIKDPSMVMAAIEAAYPNSRKLEATGDLIVFSKTNQDKKSKTNYTYELGVVRTSDELFYIYARETNLATGETKSTRVSPYRHSARALNNNIINSIIDLDSRYNATLWFNKNEDWDQRIQEEGSITLENGTVEPIHRRSEPVHRDLVEAIRAAVSKDAVNSQVVESIMRHISEFGVGDTALKEIQTNFDIDKATFTQIIDTLNAHVSVQYKVRNYGTWVSSDGETPIEVDDLVEHTNEYTKVKRIGRVKGRQSSGHATRGYMYSDYLDFRPIEGVNSDGSERLGKGSSITSKNAELIRTAQGTDGSERRAALDDYINAPLTVPVSVRPTPVTPTQPATPPAVVNVDRSRASAPTITIDGEKKPVTTNRNTSVKDFTPVDIDASQLQVGNTFMIFDDETGAPRFVEVVAVDSNPEAGTFQATVITPNSDGTADSVIHEWDINPDDGLSSVRMIAYRKPVPATPATATDDSVQNLLSTIRSRDVSFLSPEVEAEIKAFATKYVMGEPLTQDEVNELSDKVSESPTRGEVPTTVETSIAVADSIVSDSSDNGDSTAIENTAAEATLKISEIDDSGVVDDSPEKLAGYTILQNDRGVYYPTQDIARRTPDFDRLKRGEVVPPNLPFVLRDTPSGDVHYYDSTGERRWGQFGAAGALLRRKKADGTYEYLLGKRGPTLSTEPNKWSTPGGAHSNLLESQTPGFTAGKELGEELGVDMDTAQRVADMKNSVAPDWNYDYTLFEVPIGSTDKPELRDSRDIADTGWFTPEEIRKMQEDGMLHSAIDPKVLDNLFELSNTTDTPASDDVVPVVDGTTAPSLDNSTVIGGRGGSNPGENLRLDNGTEVYAKYQKSDMHASNEVAAAALYNKVGITSADIKHGTKTGRENTTFSEIIPRSSATPTNNPALKKKTQEGFAVDAWLANWDAVLNDNTISTTDGDPVRVDVGGSLLFRAQGAPKGGNFGDVVGELDTLRDPRMNSTSAAVYGSMSDADIKASATKLLDITDENIDQIVDDSFANVSPANKTKVDALKATLKARRQYILNKYGVTGTDSSGDTTNGPDSTDGTDSGASSDTTAEVTADDTTTKAEPEVAFSIEDANLGENVPMTGSVLNKFFNESGSVDYSIPSKKRSITLVVNDVAYTLLFKDSYGYNPTTRMSENYSGIRISSVDFKEEGEIEKWLLPSGSDNSINTSNVTIENLVKSLNTSPNVVINGSYLGNIQNIFSSEESFRTSAFGGEIPSIVFSTPSLARSVPSNIVNNGTDVYSIDTLTRTALKFNPETKKVGNESVSFSQLAEKISAGEQFKTGKTPSMLSTGDKATADWFAETAEGQQVHVRSGRYDRKDGYGSEPTFTKDSDGTWRDSFGLAYSDKYFISNISSATIESSGLTIGPLVIDREKAIRFDAAQQNFYVSDTQTVALRLDSNVVVFEEKTVTDTGGQYLDVKTARENITTRLLTSEEINTFLDGKFVVNENNSYRNPNLRKPPVIGQRYDGNNLDVVGNFYITDGAMVKIKYYQDMDGTQLPIELTGFLDDKEFKANSGYKIGVKDISDNFKDAQKNQLDTDGYIEYIDPDISVSKQRVVATPEQAANFKSELSTKVSDSSALMDTIGAPAMTRNEMDSFMAYLGEYGTDETSIAKATILYGSHTSGLSASEKSFYAEAASEVYAPKSSRGNKKLSDMFSRLEEVYAASTVENLPEGRKTSSRTMEMLAALMPEINKLPSVVLSDSLVGTEPNRPAIYRGVKPVRRSGVRASTLLKDWAHIENPWWGGDVGGNAAGMGQYFSSEYSTARTYAGLSYTNTPSRPTEQGRIIHGSMKSEAVEFSTKDEGSRKGKLSSMKKSGYIWLSAYLASRGIAPGTEKFNTFIEKYSRYVFDQSFFPALRGYDYSRLPDGDNRWVIYNRGMMTVVDPTPKRGKK
jgi:hypothetical protein